MSSATSLSTNDNLVLGALFDAESSPRNVARTTIHTFFLPGVSLEDLSSLQAQELCAIKLLNSFSPSPAQINTTISQLGELINRYPTYASVYSNRAQALSMLPDDSTEVQSTLYQDLCSAISLASPADANSPVSAYQMKVLSSAYTHRGKILLRCSREVAQSVGPSLPARLKGISSDSLSAMAGKDFAMGGRHGNITARHLAVQLNPFAKMCGQIVREAMLADIVESREGGLL